MIMQRGQTVRFHQAPGYWVPMIVSNVTDRLVSLVDATGRGPIPEMALSPEMVRQYVTAA